MPRIYAPPFGLPLFTSRQHANQALKALGSVEFGTGHARNRRLYTSAPRIVQVTWDLSQDQMDQVDNWFEHRLDVGSTEFIATVANIGSGVRHYESFWTKPYRTSPSQVADWTLSGEVRLGREVFLPEPSAPTLFGSGYYCARDPATGYIWATWNGTAQVPIGGTDPLTGSYVLVYNPIDMTLVTAIRFGDVSANFMSIVYDNDGHMYVGVEGNQYSAPPLAPGRPYVVTKFDCETQTIIGVGNTNYAGAVSKLGLMSIGLDDEIYISVVNGIGEGTVRMTTDAPFPYYLPGEDNSGWVFNSVYNEYSGVRVYSGYAPYLDLLGNVNLTVPLAGWINSANPQSSRMVYRDFTPHIFMCNIGSAGLIRVNTLSGAVDSVFDIGDGNRRLYSIHYSAESDRLYVEYADSFGPKQAAAYDAETLAFIKSFPLDVPGAVGNARGNSIFIGRETFVFSEGTTAAGSQLRRVSFDWR